MLKFIVDQDQVRLRYFQDFGPERWVEEEFANHGALTLSKGFHFRRSDWINGPDMEGSGEPIAVTEDAARDAAPPAEFDSEFVDLDELADLDDLLAENCYEFRFAERRNGYFHIEGRTLDIDNQVLITDEGLRLERKLFVAERGISIFPRIADLLPPDQDIVIGGEREDAIPVPVFLDLLKRFPNTTELDRYASARVATVLGDYFAPMQDARARYETYMDKTRSSFKSAAVEPVALLEHELQKYIYIRDTIADWLSSETERSEKDWQKMLIGFLLLIFPKYVAVLENLHIADHYSEPGATTSRYIDLALVDASGNLDVIEVKKPNADALVSKHRYRDNSIPARELAGSIMQAEKYLFHLSKWGAAGERKINAKRKGELPPGMTLRITNPKSMIIIGRDRRADGAAALDERQMFDLEVIKRKYANMMDIMTYDDLLRRLDNIIASLRRRTAPAST